MRRRKDTRAFGRRKLSETRSLAYPGDFAYYKIAGEIETMNNRIALAAPLLVLALLFQGCARGADSAVMWVGAPVTAAPPQTTARHTAVHFMRAEEERELLSMRAGAPAIQAPAMDRQYDASWSAAPEPAAVAQAQGRRLVRSADMNIRVEDLEQAGATISALMTRHGAHSSFANITETSRHYVIRVPADSLDLFLAELGGIGRVLFRTESTEDVSLRYYDLEGRLATQRELLETFRSYLGRAANIEEILAVEARIADLQREIDWTGRDLRHLGDLVDFSTVTLFLQGPVSSGARGELTLPERISQLMSGFGGFLSGAVVFLIGFVIYGVPILLTLALLYWLLLGRIGLLRKLYRAAAGKPGGEGKPGRGES